MFKDMKISIKILLVIIIMSLGSLLIVFSASYYFMNSMVDEFEQTNINLGLNSSNVAKSSLLSQAENNLKTLVQKQGEAANTTLYSVNRIVTESAEYTHSLYVDNSNFTGKEIPRPDETEDGVACQKYFLVKGVRETPRIEKEIAILSNCEYMFAPFLKNSDMLNNIYIGTESGISYRYSRSNLYNEDYDPRERDWYKKAAENPNTLVWLPTYLDSYGNTCITAAMSFENENGRFAGVVASDVLLTSLIDDIMSLKVGESGSCFVLDSDLNFIAHKDMSSEGFQPLLSDHFENDSFIDALQSSSDNGVVETTYEGENCYIAFSKLQETGWIFCATIKTQEVTAPAEEAKAESDELTELSQQEMQNKLFHIFRLFIIYFAIIGIAVIMISFAVSGTITRPIQRLTSSVRSIGEGNFDQKIEITSRDEVGELAKRFNEMQDNLKGYVENIKKVTAEKERIGAELNVATDIQANMLPRIFPVFPDRTEFDLYATMTPAKEVGGDFYDFFMIDHDHIALVMADVSGKGVPAALFMVISKTLIKNRALLGGTPSEILSYANEQLCEGNEAELFVTVWIAIITLSTGHGIAANAGHEHPGLKKKDGKFELIEYRHSPAVATMEGMRFREHEFKLDPGDYLFVYTDGVTEATNSDDELFGNDRLIDALNRIPDPTPKDLLGNVKKEIDLFVDDAPQFDDITMLGFQYNGPSKDK